MSKAEIVEPEGGYTYSVPSMPDFGVTIDFSDGTKKSFYANEEKDLELLIRALKFYLKVKAYLPEGSEP